MGARLGFSTYRDGTYRPNSNVPDGVYAPEPLMEMADWEAIKAWYQSHAPDQLALPDWQSRTRLNLFAVEVPERGEFDFPAATAIFIDEVDKRLLVGDSYQLDLEIYDKDLKFLAQVRPGGVTSRISRLPSGNYLATIMGGTIGQAEGPRGLLVEIVADKNSPTHFTAKSLARNLHRPINMAFGDINKDGNTDYLVAGFGAHFGKLSLHLSQPDGTLDETTVLNEAGSTALTLFEDDLLALISQGNERIVRLKDFAQGQPVTEQILLRFPPSQGSSSMSTLDFNGDGIIDLLYTAGDNADISPIFKPYHGVYLFAGQPDKTFKLAMFFHLDGATSAIAKDFDQDGDIDIAAIAYYANIDRGLDQSEFVYLENDAETFEPKYIEGLGKLGRFVAISAGDLDGDGDIDIALANLAFGPPGPIDIPPALQDQWVSGTSFVLLRNELN